MQKLQKDRQGFTIIEVLIVLAIAGLILLIVFLAVPALQRNSRNTGRRNDVGRIAAGVNDYIANNNGLLPANAGQFNTIVSNSGNFAQFTATAPDNAGIESGPEDPLAGSTPSYRLVTSAKCGSGGATVGAGGRQAAIQYTLETSGDVTPACLDV